MSKEFSEQKTIAELIERMADSLIDDLIENELRNRRDK